MNAYEELWEAQRIIGKHWRQDQAPEQTLVLGLARDALDFISVTGQRYRFRDYRQQQASTASQVGAAQATLEPLDGSGSQQHGSPDAEQFLQRAVRFFINLLNAPQSPGEVELLRVVVDALHFIATTGQLASLEEYIQHLDAGAPPYVVASFTSMEQAETWLMEHPDPPDFAHIIIGNEYRSVSHDRQSNIRRLPNDNAIEYYLAELQKEEPPVPLASFSTPEEAEAWLRSQPEPARRAWLLIGGELYLAAYYPNINHRALFPLSMAEGYQV
jgi:hypothetical protein